eukprot:9258861-Alexandrium_andersonii.AAC.1
MLDLIPKGIEVPALGAPLAAPAALEAPPVATEVAAAAAPAQMDKARGHMLLTPLLFFLASSALLP